METLLIIVAGTVSVLLGVVELCFLANAILSFFADEDNAFYRFTGLVVEPFVRPVRALLVKMNWLQDGPIDFSFFIACLLVGLVSTFLI